MELKETISQLSDESLIELWKSEQLCTNEYFSTLYNINLKTFNDFFEIDFELFLYDNKISFNVIFDVINFPTKNG